MPKSNSIQNSKEINFFTADFLGIGGKIIPEGEDFVIPEVTE